jgi:hypothetical protein
LFVSAYRLHGLQGKETTSGRLIRQRFKISYGQNCFERAS